MAGQMIVAGLDIGAHSLKCVIGVQHEDGQWILSEQAQVQPQAFKMGPSQTEMKLQRE